VTEWAPQDLLNLLPYRTDLDPGRWLTHHIKPAHQQAEDFLGPKDTSREICTYVRDPTGFEYIRILSQHTLHM
jgi:hypothetical protein